MFSIKKIEEFLNYKTPKEAAESWDNVGLLLGHSSAQTSGVVVSLDLTHEAIEKAIQNNCRAIILHHPFIFPKQKGIHRIAVESGPNGLSSLMMKAIENHIALLVSHTNFDRCALEVNERIAQVLGCEVKARLFDANSDRLLKLVVFSPPSHSQKIREALWEEGAGNLGFYDHCQFTMTGKGSFRPLKGSDPYQGESGVTEFTAEDRLEFVLPKTLKNRVISRLLRTHPYEEVAYDLMEVLQRPPAKGVNAGVGYGFIGHYKEPISFPELANRVKALFEIENFWLTRDQKSSYMDGRKKDEVKTIAFSPGKGSSFVSEAIKHQCDVFVTGEVGFHSAQDGVREGLSTIEVGHRESEKFFLEVMRDWFTELGLVVHVCDSRIQGFYSE